MNKFEQIAEELQTKDIFYQEQKKGKRMATVYILRGRRTNSQTEINNESIAKLFPRVSKRK